MNAFEILACTEELQMSQIGEPHVPKMLFTIRGVLVGLLTGQNETFLKKRQTSDLQIEYKDSQKSQPFEDAPLCRGCTEC